MLAQPKAFLAPLLELLQLLELLELLLLRLFLFEMTIEPYTIGVGDRFAQQGRAQLESIRLACRCRSRQSQNRGRLCASERLLHGRRGGLR